MSLLKVENLHVEIEGEKILRGLNLEVNAGEVHAIMGPNGSGKSTLASVIAGREQFEITEGKIYYQGEDISELDPHERAQKGVFLAFQYPVEIPGVTNANFMKSSINAIRKSKGQDPLPAKDFIKKMKESASLVEIDKSFMSRAINEGFSGGEKKRNEIFQLAMLEPKLALLDETDSGLDIDALKVVSNGVNKLRKDDNAFVLITHYQRLLNYITPDFVHVLAEGKIIKSGGKEIAIELEDKGYEWMKEHKNEEITA